jgi:8-oxo-dGTP pyrophosphatase MutT (NUDIX family)
MAELLALVRAQVAARPAVDAREQAAIDRILQELDRLAAPFEEHADPTHVTGSGIVVGPRGVLLHRHKRLGLWLQPGGHVDAGETPWDAAQREVLEETGLEARPDENGARLVHVDVHPGGRGHVHLDLRYLLYGPDAEPAPPPGESPDVAWFDWDHAIGVADPGLVGALRALRPETV